MVLLEKALEARDRQRKEFIDIGLPFDDPPPALEANGASGRSA